MKSRLAALVATALAVAGPTVARARPAPAPVPADADVLAQIDRIVRAKFYSLDVLRERRWDESVKAARAAFDKASPAKRREILTALVASLRTSHTEYLPPDDPRHAQLLAIFEGILPEAKEQCPDPSKIIPLPVEISDIGVWWQRLEGRWFVGGVLDDGPAKKAGLLVGDEVVTADGAPFQPVAAFAAGPGRRVRLAIRRTRGGALRTLTVEPRRGSPQEAFRSALAASARIIEHRGARIAYVHVWSWTGAVMQEALEEAIATLNKQKPTAYVVDIRDGWGGASPDYLRIFDTRIPVLQSTSRDGAVFFADAHIRVPAVVLINRGSRSGKEAIAYGVKKHRLARLVGDTTGGAFLPGSPFCLDDGAVLYLARSHLTVDGEVLEARGVAPDISIPFDLRFAAGKDPQLAAALDAAASAAAK